MFKGNEKLIRKYAKELMDLRFFLVEINVEDGYIMVKKALIDDPTPLHSESEAKKYIAKNVFSIESVFGKISINKHVSPSFRI